MDYWVEGISQAFDEIGIVATQKQIEFVADAVDGAHQMYGQAHGYDSIPNPLQDENKRLKQLLKDERDKVTCNDCNGQGGKNEGRSYFTCGTCRGEGRL